jgi:hypothetical protein
MLTLVKKEIATPSYNDGFCFRYGERCLPGESRDALGKNDLPTISIVD